MKLETAFNSQNLEFSAKNPGFPQFLIGILCPRVSKSKLIKFIVIAAVATNGLKFNQLGTSITQSDIAQW